VSKSPQVGPLSLISHIAPLPFSLAPTAKNARREDVRTHHSQESKIDAGTAWAPIELGQFFFSEDPKNKYVFKERNRVPTYFTKRKWDGQKLEKNKNTAFLHFNNKKMPLSNQKASTLFTFLHLFQIPQK